MSQRPNKNSGKGKLSTFITLVVLLAVAGGLLANETRIIDWWKLRGYVPAPMTISLATDTTMNDYARHLFYINKPEILSSVKSFRAACPENQDTIVLGCYHSDEDGIYVYDVPDASLAGVQQVTAAHEMLHAAYDRLSNKDREAVDQQLMAFYKTGAIDPEVKAEIAIYQKTEPDSVTNEMHSLFGTEIAKLPPGLETYYKRYFNDRAKIVSYQQNYQDQFNQRQATIASDDKQLDDQKKSIDGQQAALKDQLTQINTDRARINGLASTGSVNQYNAAVPGFNAEIDAYNRAVTSLQGLVDSYNQLVATRNQIAGQLATLDKALDTRTAATVAQ